VKSVKGSVFMRFAHEMNGNWYPWAGTKVGREKYIGMYRHVKDVFIKEGAQNVKWVFSINWEDVPRGESNNFANYYPGDDYVDFIGIDGYNWGDTQPWSRWMSFRELFKGVYHACGALYPGKPVLISEFATAGSGGDKAAWIKAAFEEMKKMDRVCGFVIFNVDKEVDWRAAPDSAAGKELRRSLQDPHFQ
jgi:beta-mannanase